MISALVLASIMGLSDSRSNADVTYEIPASDLLEVPLVMNVEDAFFLKRKGFATMSFRLPPLLDGKKGQVFELGGAVEGDTILMEGEGAVANCLTAPRVTECSIKFDQLALDKIGADQILDLTLQGPIADAIRLGRDAFEHQAVGIIRFTH